MRPTSIAVPAALVAALALTSAARAGVIVGTPAPAAPAFDTAGQQPALDWRAAVGRFSGAPTSADISLASQTAAPVNSASGVQSPAPAPVPEPASLALLAAGLIMLPLARRRSA